MKKTLDPAIAFLILLSISWAALPYARTDPLHRPQSWAIPIERPGLPNLFKVSEYLYRGAQPERRGYAELKKMGIRTIVNLRETDADRAMARKYGIGYAHIPIETSSPMEEDFRNFLGIALDPSRQPVFVHCRHGADRTGTAVALYRIKAQKWNREDAIREMVDGGYGFHAVFGNLKKFIRKYP